MAVPQRPKICTTSHHDKIPWLFLKRFDEKLFDQGMGGFRGRWSLDFPIEEFLKKPEIRAVNRCWVKFCLGLTLVGTGILGQKLFINNFESSQHPSEFELWIDRLLERP